VTVRFSLLLTPVNVPPAYSISPLKNANESEYCSGPRPTLEGALLLESTTSLPKCKKRKKPSSACLTSQFGCCPDGKTSALGPFNANCMIPKSCEETKFGCCPDGVTPSPGPYKARCSKIDCKETLFGCCPDGRSAANGNNFQGCEQDCEKTTSVTLTLALWGGAVTIK
jgi:hypothetical protein